MIPQGYSATAKGKLPTAKQISNTRPRQVHTSKTLAREIEKQYYQGSRNRPLIAPVHAAGLNKYSGITSSIATNLLKEAQNTNAKKNNLKPQRIGDGAPANPVKPEQANISVEDKLEKLLIRDQSKTDFGLPRPSASYYYEEIPAYHLLAGAAQPTTPQAAGEAIMNGTSSMTRIHAKRNTYN